MKKTFKKLFAALLAAALVLAMAVPAFAVTNTGTNGSITIDNAVDGETYTIYRMFKLDSYNGDAYSYTVEPAWETFFSTGAGSSYIDLDSNGHPTWKNGADAAAFAKAALTWANNSSTIHNDGQGLASNKTVSFSNLPLGYYLVDSSLGALCSLDTTNPSATIKEKNGVPAMDKKIVTGENSTSDSSTAKIGDTVNYKVTIEVAKGASDYELTDTMSDGLSFSSGSIKVDGVALNDTIATLTLKQKEGDPTFTLTFADSYVADKIGKTIVVTYSATLNDKAAVGDTGDGNTNSATLTYGNNKSVTHTTTTRTYEFDLLKVDGADHKLLNGAEFKLYDAKTSGNIIKVVRLDNGNYRVAMPGESGSADIIAVNGKVRISGLDKTIYWLEETKAPDGYNKLTERKPVDLTSGSNNTTLTSDTWSEADHGVAVENNAGAILPDTGGMGTTLFYVIGGGLMVAAVVLLVTKKRMEHKN